MAISARPRAAQGFRPKSLAPWMTGANLAAIPRGVVTTVASQTPDKIHIVSLANERPGLSRSIAVEADDDLPSVSDILVVLHR